MHCLMLYFSMLCCINVALCDAALVNNALFDVAPFQYCTI